MLTISYTIKERSPVNKEFLVKAANKVLGKKYSLSLVFVGGKRSKALNFKYRKIKKPTDILSFELDKNSGEIYVNPKEARRKAKLFSKTYPNYLKFVFIHGLCHLKGMVHGSRMNYQEKKFRTLLKV